MSDIDHPADRPVNARTMQHAVDQWRDAGLITAEQATAIVGFERHQGDLAIGLPSRPPTDRHRRGLNAGAVFSYIGGFLILFALTIWIGAGWDTMSRGGQFTWACIAVFGLWGTGAALRRARGAELGGNLLLFAGTGAFPLLVYSFQRLVGWWPDDRGSLDYEDFHDQVLSVWIAMDLIALAVAAIVARLTRFPLLMLLVGFWGWYLAMDLTSLAGGEDHNAWDDSNHWIGVLVALVILGAGSLLRLRQVPAFAFWLFLFGNLVWLGHLGDLAFGSDFQAVARLLFLLFAIAAIATSVAWQSRAFLVFGAFGLYAWVSYMVFQVFEGVGGITVGLVLIGLFIVLTGVAWQRQVEPEIERRLASRRSGRDGRGASG